MEKLIYLVVLIVPLFVFKKNFTEYKIKESEKKEDKLLFLTFFIYFIFAAIRGNGNGDYFNYLKGVPLINTFEDIFFIENYPFEIGFRVIAYINNVLNLNAQFTIAAINFISLASVYFVIQKYSKDKILSSYLYFSFFILYDMHHIRTGLSMNLVMITFFLLIGKKYLKSLIPAFFAVCFHRGSLLALGVVYIYFLLRYLFESNKKTDLHLWLLKNKTKIQIILMLVLAVTIVYISPSTVLINLLDVIGLKNLSFKLLSYLENDRWSYPFRLYDPRLILLILTFFMSKNMIKSSTILEESLMDMSFIAIIIVILFSESTMFVMRFYNYFNLFTIFLIPEILEINFEKRTLDEKWLKNIKCLIILIYLIYFVALIYIQVPYAVYFIKK